VGDAPRGNPLMGAAIRAMQKRSAADIAERRAAVVDAVKAVAGDIEIGTSFGPLRGRIWRIGTMGYNARADAVEQTLRALEAVLSQQKLQLPRGAAVDAALSVYR